MPSAEDAARETRAKALAAMYKDGQERSGEGCSGPPTGGGKKHHAVMPLASPVEMADSAAWSKTKLVEAIPGWVTAHEREVAQLAAWAESLLPNGSGTPELAGRRGTGRGPSLGGGAAGLALRGAYSELLGREVAKGANQGLPGRIW